MIVTHTSRIVIMIRRIMNCEGLLTANIPKVNLFSVPLNTRYCNNYNYALLII